MDTSVTEQPSTSGTRRGQLRWAWQMIAGLVIFAAILFLSSGQLNWPGGWAYLAMNAITQLLSALLLSARQPEMLAQRSGAQKGTKDWDKFFAPAIILMGSLVVIITAGLDRRFGWSAPIAGGVWVVALIAAFASQMFVLWAMASNPFFVTTVRIQEDRQHTAISGGPYRLVRHPGYLGSLVYTLAIPLVLGSWWTFIPAAVTIVLIVVRTGLEDTTLQAELSGYREYSEQVRSRLIPGVW